MSGAVVLLACSSPANEQGGSDPASGPRATEDDAPEPQRDRDPADADDARDAPTGDTPPAASPTPQDDAEPPDDDPEQRHTPNLDVALALTPVASMTAPIAGAVGPDEDLYLAERAGTVHALTEDGIGPAVIDVSTETTTDVERGLLGIAFSATGDALYLSLTDTDGDTLVREVAVVDGEIRADEQRDVFTYGQPQGNHNGGAIAVGPDGYLYLALGDGGGAGDPRKTGQDRSTALGSLVRIDPAADAPYAVPADNPFVDDADAMPEVFAYGLRNPWRFSFDRDTDELWIADVGQSGREEINRVGPDTARGANFGWNLLEGSSEFTGEAPDDHVPPVYEYDTGGAQGCAIVGGYVYRGAAVEELRGAYLYADYCQGEVRALHVDADGTVQDQRELGIDAGGVLSFAEDAAGEIYVLADDGEVYRIDPAG